MVLNYTAWTWTWKFATFIELSWRIFSDVLLLLSCLTSYRHCCRESSMVEKRRKAGEVGKGGFRRCRSNRHNQRVNSNTGSKQRMTMVRINQQMPRTVHHFALSAARNALSNFYIVSSVPRSIPQLELQQWRRWIMANNELFCSCSLGWNRSLW